MKTITCYAPGILLNIAFIHIVYDWFNTLPFILMLIINMSIQLPIYFFQLKNISTKQPEQIKIYFINEN